jgi:hypothetical protein
MQTKNLAAWNILTSSGKLDSTAGADGLPKPVEIGTFRFDVADTMALVKNGFGWESGGGETIDTAAGETEKGVRYTFAAQPNPSDDSIAEKRFYFTEMGELCFKMRFHVPANYFHRACLNVSVVGDISAWQIGDSILGGDGTSTATIYWIDGFNVFLLFAENDLQGAPIWTANITNVTRAQVRASTRVSNEANNNKLLAFWCDGYSYTGASPSIAWELRADMNGGSLLYYHFGADYQVVGTLPNSTSPLVEFIRPSDSNKWFDMIIYMDMASTEIAEDGVIKTFLQREGETGYTQLHTQANAKIGARAAGGNARFQHGYCHGWSNSGFQQETIFRDSIISLNNSSIDGVGR